MNKKDEQKWQHAIIPDAPSPAEMVFVSVQSPPRDKMLTVGDRGISSRRNHSKTDPRFLVPEQDIVLGPPGLLFFGALVSLLVAGITMLGS